MKKLKGLNKMKDAMKMTVKEVFEKDIASGRRSPLTAKQVEDASKSSAFDLIIDLRLEELTADVLRTWIDDLIDKEYSPHTINNYFLILNKIQFNETGKKLKVKRPPRPSKKDIQKKTITEDELTRALLYADVETMKAILLCYYANMNNHEIEILQYKDIYYDNNAICLHSKIENINGIWHHTEDTIYDQNMRFALIPKEVMQVIGHGAPNDRVFSCDHAHIASKCNKTLEKAGINIKFKSLKLAALYKKVNINPLGIIDNQAAFCFADNDMEVIDCATEFAKNERKGLYNIENAFLNLEGVKLKDLNRKVLQNWIDKISLAYEDYGLRRAYNLLRDTLLYISNGMFHLEKFNFVLKSKKEGYVYLRRKHDIDLDKVRMIMDKADIELKKAMLLCGYGDFTLTELVNIKIKDIDKEQNVITYNGKSRAFTKSAIRFMGKGDPEDVICSKNASFYTSGLKTLVKTSGVKCDFISLRGAYIAPPPPIL